MARSNPVAQLKRDLRPVTLLCLPQIIDGVGTYLTRSGETVTIHNVLPPSVDFNCVGRYEGGLRESWHPSGRLYYGTLSENDIVARVED